MPAEVPEQVRNENLVHSWRVWPQQGAQEIHYSCGLEGGYGAHVLEYEKFRVQEVDTQGASTQVTVRMTDDNYKVTDTQ